MEAAGDACAVAATIVGLTEGAMPDLNAVTATLSASGIGQDRISAIVRALRPYADLLDPNAVKRVHLPPAALAALAAPWWKRLFA